MPPRLRNGNLRRRRAGGKQVGLYSVERADRDWPHVKCSVSYVRFVSEGGRAYSGMFPCFFGGFFSRLVSSPASAAISFARVCLGRITSSTNPRDAAT